MARILVTGLNPAWQKTLEYDLLHLGQVNRATACHEFAAGKGFNVAKILRRFGHEAWLLQVLGGTHGQKFAAACHREGIRTLNVEVSAETRVCTTLIDKASGEVTELIEPFGVAPAENAMQRALDLIPPEPGFFDAAAFCGTAPSGMNPSLYLEVWRKINAPFSVLDSFKDLPRELWTGVTCLKINRHELEELERTEAGWIRRWPRIPLILVTDGPRPARFLRRDRDRLIETTFPLPRLEKVLNPIGSGDTVTAAFTHFALSGLPMPEAFRQALAVGSASCLTMVPGEFREEERQTILTEIQPLDAPGLS
jgi:fructose-1-phosphate kinase PfkB-like protein